MKIVDVCAFYAPRGGGVRTYVERKLIAGPRAGHEIVIVAPGSETRTEERGPGARIQWIKAPRFPLDKNYRYFADREALHALLDAERADVIEASSPWRSASIVGDWRGDARLSLIAHADPLSAYAYRWFGGVAERTTIDRQFDWYWRHLRRLDSRFDFVVSASESLSGRLRDGGLGKVVTNPMGVDPGVFAPGLRDERLRRRMLGQCGLSADATLLLGVGRHSAEKRWDLVVEAATAAAWRHPVGLMIVGDGHARQKVARAVGLNPHIRLIAPIGDRTMLARTMASADALIHGCDAETFCFVAAEARAAGLPLIVPDLGGASDHARASGGHLFRSGNAEDAARAITVFIEGGRKRPNMAGEPRTMDDHFDDLFALYRGSVPQRVAA